MRVLMMIAFVLLAAWPAAGQSPVPTSAACAWETVDGRRELRCTLRVVPDPEPPPPPVDPPPPPPPVDPPPPPVDPPPPPTGDVLFRMDCTAAWPSCGFSYTHTQHEGQYWRRTRLVGQAPSGRDAARITGISTTTVNQYDAGWIFTPRTAVPQGSTMTVSWQQRLNAPIGRGVNGKAAGGKLLIVGNTCEKSPHAPTRVISNLDNGFVRFEQNVAGPPSRGETTVGMDVGAWHAYELVIRSGSTTTARDGLLVLKVDGREVSRSSGGFRLQTSGWSTARCSDSGLAFVNTFNTLASGQLSIDVADLVVSVAQ